MTMHAPTFYNAIRPMMPDNKLTGIQVARIEAILAACTRERLTKYETAYILATGHHESARWTRYEEIGKGRKHTYGNPVLIFPGHTRVYYGRGAVQITWLTNYARMGTIIGRDLVNQPDIATDPDIAAEIIVQGMVRGSFTGLSMEDCNVASGYGDIVKARRIINPDDLGEQIKAYYRAYLNALTDAANTAVASVDAETPTTA